MNVDMDQTSFEKIENILENMFHVNMCVMRVYDKIF